MLATVNAFGYVQETPIFQIIKDAVTKWKGVNSDGGYKTTNVVLLMTTSELDPQETEQIRIEQQTKKANSNFHKTVPVRLLKIKQYIDQTGE
jgi:hypothetical protein